MADDIALVTDEGTPGSVTPGGVLTNRAPEQAFQVHLDVFSGPFDLLLGLISKHKLDITEVALAQVTDEFIAHIRAQHDAAQPWDLSQASEFLLVAATLLELKAARLLPQSGPVDEEDLALIEARDLLFARLLQYRAFKDVARRFAEQMAGAGRTTPRMAGLEPEFAALLPELVITATGEDLARLAALALTPKPVEGVGLDHLHAPAVSVREQAAVLVGRLRRVRAAAFRTLVEDADSRLVVVARFLAVLELYRDGAVALEQVEALGDLTVRWTGADTGDVVVTDDWADDEPDDSLPVDGIPTDDASTPTEGASDD